MHLIGSKWTLALAVSTITAVIISQPLPAENTKAEQRPDADRGKQIALRLCVNCHVMPQDDASTVPAGVPPFTVIANRPDQTAQHIRGVLIQPHPPMPNMHLTRMEIDDIIAYLDTLREKTSGSPLFPSRKPSGPKLIYPDAS